MDFIQQDTDSVFDKIYYKNFRKTFIGKGEGWIIDVDIIIDNLVGFNLTGTGLTLAINPATVGNTTVMNFTTEFFWPIF